MPLLASRLPFGGRDNYGMERSVRTHIEELERTVRLLNDQMMRLEDVHQRNELEAKVRAAQTALRHYQAALAIEQDLNAARR